MIVFVSWNRSFSREASKGLQTLQKENPLGVSPKLEWENSVQNMQGQEEEEEWDTQNRGRKKNKISTNDIIMGQVHNTLSQVKFSVGKLIDFIYLSSMSDTTTGCGIPRGCFR